MTTFEQAAETVLRQALEMRATKGEPEAIDLPIYESEASLRRAGVLELSLEEHTQRVQHIAKRLEEHGFRVNVFTSPTEL
ncbi:hypothetical protein ACN082_09685 [Rothia sp. CCM 9417]|uniref:hypothetical protein n=1 Tax=Rothia sp. CCM 9417 TaxID=3402657 RepID=UPI003AEA23E3